MFRKWFEATQPGHLYKQLFALRGQMAKEAQEIYNAWEQDSEGIDFEFGGGGICDQISNAIGGIIMQHIPGVEVTEAGQDGDDHSWVVVYNETEAYHVDIPPGVYERGGGYTWHKIPGIIFQPNHIEIYQANRKDMEYL